MQITYSLALPPGHCFICRSAQREAYVDTGVSLDYEGAFYICNLCVNEIAHLFAFISFDEYKDLRSSKEDLERINFELIKRVGALEESLRALANAGYNVGDDNTVIRSGGFPVQTVETVRAESQGGKKKLGDGEGKTSESVHDEGVGELSSDKSGSDSDFALDI
jgi:hypothetical protein